MVRSLPAESHAARIVGAASVARGKPNLVASGRPENALDRGPSSRQDLFFTFTFGVDHSNRSLVIPAGILMVGKGHPLAIRGNLGLADPVDAINQNFANGIFQPPMAVFRRVTDHRHLFAVRGPVHVLNVVQHFARRSATEWNASQRPGGGVSPQIVGVQPDRQLAILGNRQQLGVLQSQLTRSGIVAARGVHLFVTAVPVGAVNNAAIRGEARVSHGTSAEGNLLIFGDGNSGVDPAQPPANRQRCQRAHAHDGRGQPGLTLQSTRWNREDFGRASGKTREMFKVKSNVAGGMETLLGIFLQAMLHDPFQRRRNILVGVAQVGRILFQDRAHGVGSGIAVEGALAGEHLVEDGAESEDVGAVRRRPRRAPAPATCSRRCPARRRLSVCVSCGRA